MASAVSVPNNFVAGTPTVADDVDANFDAIVSWINTNAVHLDASKAFTGIPSGPASNPTTANQLARKAYVDSTASSEADAAQAAAEATASAYTDAEVAAATDRVGCTVDRSSTSFSVSAGTTSYMNFDTEVADTDAMWSSGAASTITIPSGKDGVYGITLELYAVENLLTVDIEAGTRSFPCGTASAGSGFYASTMLVLSATNTIKVSLTNPTGSVARTQGRIYVYRVSL